MVFFNIYNQKHMRWYASDIIHKYDTDIFFLAAFFFFSYYTLKTLSLSKNLTLVLKSSLIRTFIVVKNHQSPHVQIKFGCSSWTQSSNEFSIRVLSSGYKACRRKLKHSAATVAPCCRLHACGKEKRPVEKATFILTLSSPCPSSQYHRQCT